MTSRRIKRFLMKDVRSRIVGLWLAGCPARDISILTGASVSTVYRWLRRFQGAFSVANVMEESIETSTGYLALWSHLNLQLWMSALTAAHGQYLDTYHILKSVLADPVHFHELVTTDGSCQIILKVDPQMF